MNPLRRSNEPASETSQREAATPILLDLSDQKLVLLVHRQMRTLCGNHPDLDDLTQTALEQLLLARFDGRSKLSTFTHAVCYRVWMKHLRFSYRLFARVRLTDDGTLPEGQGDPNAASDLESRERIARLYLALEKIPPKRRAVVTLHDIAGLDVEEIARIVEAKLGTVRSRLRDGRKKLAALVLNDPYFGGKACEDGSS